MTTFTPALPERDFAAFLFDMDGTILTSIKAAERVWSDWARSHGLDVEAFLPTIHGKRTEDTIRNLNLPGVDPAAEARRITLAEIDDVAGIEAIEGVAAFLDSLPPFLLGAQKLGVYPEHCLVFEDTLAGLQAAEAAGMDSIVVTATHTHAMDTTAYDVPDYAELLAVQTEDGLLRLQRKSA